MGLIVLVVLGFAASTIRPSGDWSQDRLMLSAVVNLERNSRAGIGVVDTIHVPTLA